MAHFERRRERIKETGWMREAQRIGGNEFFIKKLEEGGEIHVRQVD